MSFSVPTFNLTINIWRFSANINTDPPDVITTGNLAWGRRGATPVTGGTSSRGFIVAAPVLLLPAGTDIRSGEKGTFGQEDKVECPAGSGRTYYVNYVEDIGKGFPNEHRGAIIIPFDTPWPTPYP